MFRDLLIIATTSCVTIIIAVPTAIMAVRHADTNAATISANKAIYAAHCAGQYALAASNYAEECALVASNYAKQCTKNRKYNTYSQSEILEID